MKHYNRTTKKWEEDKPVGSLKKPETCKGKKPHNFVLILPSYVSRNHNLFKEEIEKFYDIEDKRLLANEFFDNQLKEIGIGGYFYKRIQNKHFKCSVCGKEKYE